MMSAFGGIDAFARAMLGALADSWAQGALLLACAAAACLVLGRAPAALRHLVWSIAVLGLLILPALAALVPGYRLGAMPGILGAPSIGAPIAQPAEPQPPFALAAAGAPSAISPRPVGEAPGAAPRAPDAVEPFPTAPSSSSVEASPAAAVLRAPSAIALLALVWLSGAAACMVRYAIGAARASGIARRARPWAPQPPVAAATGGARVLVSPEIRVPFAWGFLRPAIILPADAPAWPEGRLRSVLLHEASHLRRKDVLLGLVSRAALALHWPDPLAWLAARRLRIEGELSCDDRVIREGTSPASYAGHLLEVARSLGKRPALPAGDAMARTGKIEGRLRAILDGSRRRGVPGWRASALAVACAATVLIPLSALRLAGVEGTPGEAPPPAPADGTAAAPAAGGPFTVAKDGSAPFDSIAKAIEAAKEGATVRIGPGVYEEALTLSRPLTLEGAGPEKTSIVSGDPSFDPQMVETEVRAKLRDLKTDEEKKAFMEEMRKKFLPRPAILVEGAKGVEIRGLKASLRGKSAEGSVGPGAVIEFKNASGAVVKAIVAGSPGSGIVIGEGSDVEVRDSLVAGVRGTGIAVGGREARARISGCDVRSCYHRGITIGRGCDAAVERCRISGSAWHGIRYDDASPLVAGNVIFRNERFGIYASGKTSAKVTGNLFLENGMAGVSCWYGSVDAIEGNTFALNKRSDIELLRGALPAIRKNVFDESPRAIYREWPGEEAAKAEVLMEGNWFWKVEAKAVGPRPSSEEGKPYVEEAIPLDPAKGNVDGDPGFARPDAFVLAPDGAARKAGAGAADPASLESPWSLQPEEAPEVERKEVAGRKAAEGDAERKAGEIAKPWIEDAMSISDPSKVAAAVAEIRRALASGDPIQVQAGLTAFIRTGDVNYEKASFRDLILPLARSAEGGMRVQAFYALNMAGRTPEDLRLLLDALKDPSPELAPSASHLLFLYTEGKIEGEAAGVVLRLLGSGDENLVRETLRGLWGAQASPEVQARLLEVAKTSARHDAIYFGLSTLANKFPAVVDELIRAAEDPDSNVSGRAVWGLGHGVPEESRRKAADFALRLFEARGAHRLRSDCLGMLGQYGDASHLPALEALEGNGLLKDDLRAAARDAIGKIQSRL
jgi:beta-lactamase regulating signal transducer with metallopeptidase domain